MTTGSERLRRPPAQRLGAGLVQRAAECAALERCLAEAERGSGSLVLIEGEAGIGKSTIVEAALLEAARRGIARRAARGRELERDAPFGVARQLLERSPVTAPAAERAADAPRRDRAQRAAATIDALVDVVRQLVGGRSAAGRPLLLAVDDGHWADGPSLRFLVQLADRVERLPVVLVIALRADASAAPRRELRWLRTHHAAQILRLEPLGDSAVEELVTRRFPGCEPPFWRACAHVSGGNPFLLNELLTALAEDGATGTAEDARAARRVVPDSVLRSVLARLGRLPPAATALARSVAVLGEPSLRHAAALARLDPQAAEGAADVLAQARILCPGEPLRFVHPLLAAAVDRDLPAFARAAEHRRAAQLLAQEGAPAEQLAGHLLAARRNADPWVVGVLRDAAVDAMASADPASAARLLCRALAEPPPAEARAALLLELARAEAASGSGAAVEHFSEALGLLDEGSRRARAALELAGVLFARLDLVSAAEVAARGEAEAAQSPALAEALSTIHLIAASLLPARGAAVKRVAALRRDALEHRLAPVPELMTLVALTMAVAGDPPALIRDLVERALGAEPADPAVASLLLPMFLPIAMICVDELAVAQSVADRLLERAEREGNVLASAFCRQWRSSIALRQGDLHHAAAEAERALAIRADGWEAATDHSAATLAVARLDLGLPEDARAAIAYGREAAGRAMQPVLLHARGRLAMAEGDAAAALDDFQAAGRYLQEAFSITNPAMLAWRADAALALHHLGDAAGARRLAGAEVHDARRLGLTHTLGVALRANGVVAERPRSIPLLREAVALLERSPARLEHARASCELGAALRRQGQRAAAHAPLAHALEQAQALGAVALADRAMRELHALGRRPRRPARSGPEALTATERRVAELASRGLTNRQIAAELLVTTRTVEWHLNNAYGKLGIGARGQLAGVLCGRPDPP